MQHSDWCLLFEGQAFYRVELGDAIVVNWLLRLDNGEVAFCLLLLDCFKVVEPLLSTELVFNNLHFTGCLDAVDQFGCG